MATLVPCCAGMNRQGTVALEEPRTCEQMSPFLGSPPGKPMLWEQDPLLSVWGVVRDECEGVS